MRVVKHWKRLSRETLECPPFKVFKAGWDMAVSRTAWHPGAPSSPKHSMILFQKPSQ